MNHRHSSRRALALLVLAALMLASAVAGASYLPLPTAEATASITARDLEKHLRFLASDRLGGRDTLRPSKRVGARYPASLLEFYCYPGAVRDCSLSLRV